MLAIKRSILLLLFFKVISLSLASPGGAVQEANEFPFTLFHTNDLHSHFEGTGPDRYFTALRGDGDPVQGHYARLAFMIKKLTDEKKSEKEPYLLMDAGDFFSGTLFHTLAPRKDVGIAPELEFFESLSPPNTHYAILVLFSLLRTF